MPKNNAQKFQHHTITYCLTRQNKNKNNKNSYTNVIISRLITMPPHDSTEVDYSAYDGMQQSLKVETKSEMHCGRKSVSFSDNVDIQETLHHMES